MKTYHLYHGRSRQSHSKLQRVQTQRRVELELKKSASSKRVQRYDKQTEKVCIAIRCFVTYWFIIHTLRSIAEIIIYCRMHIVWLSHTEKFVKNVQEKSYLRGVTWKIVQLQNNWICMFHLRNFSYIYVKLHDAIHSSIIFFCCVHI